MPAFAGMTKGEQDTVRCFCSEFTAKLVLPSAPPGGRPGGPASASAENLQLPAFTRVFSVMPAKAGIQGE
jgi:hypothetical protein